MLRLIFLIMCVCVGSETVFAEEIPRNWQLGLGAPQTVETPDWNYAIPREVSRKEGVAPLSVSFIAGLEESTATKRTFHNYEYSWDFDVQDIGNENETWGTNGRPKKYDKGPVAAHVYETAGEYEAKLTIRNASGVVDTESFFISVSEPNDVFAGSKTTCVSTTSDFTGCPAGADTITTTDLSDMPSWTESGERLLFHRGSSWTAPTGLYGSSPAPTTTAQVGAYGTCEAPDVNGICLNSPVITVTQGDGGDGFFTLYKSNDFRVSDISLVSEKSIGGVTTGATDIKNFLALRLKIRGFGVGVGWGHWLPGASDEITGNFVVSCDIQDFGSYGLYVGSDRLALLGNNVHNSDTTHVVRVWWSHLGVINHNLISGSSLTNTNGRHGLKFHGPDYDQVGPVGPGNELNVPFNTQFSVIANNTFGSSGPWPVFLCPADQLQDARLSDIIFEKNKILPAYGEHSSKLVERGIRLTGRYFTVRNNVIDSSYENLVSSGFSGIHVVNHSYAPSTLGIQIYNNTIFGDYDFRNTATGVEVDSGVDDIVIKNNYISFPSEPSKTIIVDNSGKAVLNNNIMTDDPGFVDGASIPTILRDLSYTPARAIDNVGDSSVPVFDDFNGSSRWGVNDVGAFQVN
ncbi:MAG: hypothetical protein ACI8ZB_003413 [Desulforhopalus sp.]|jgi:hypothetical protein